MCGYLRDKGYLVDVVLTAEEAIGKAQNTQDYLLCILDMSMPRRRSYRVLEAMRQANVKWPILALTNHSSIDELVAVYAAGADDVMRKPISMELINCKIEVLLRRERGNALNRQKEFELGDKHFDSVHQLLDDVHLSGRENDLLLMLCRHRNELVERSVILRTLWGVDNFYTARSLSVYVNHLRHLLEGTGIRIMSVHGKGYKMVV